MVKYPFALLFCAIVSCGQVEPNEPLTHVDEDILHYVVDLKTQDLKLFWKNDKGEIFSSFSKLKSGLDAEGKVLSFAMNGGMYMENRAPLGLYIEEGEQLSRFNRTQDAHGNFYLQPNGVFHVDKSGRAGVTMSKELSDLSHLRFATQSGPMLLINGQIHPKLTKGSENLHVRNGVGILPDGRVLFAMSKRQINFYDFATFFKKNGCKQALYLDGGVSKTYLPAKEWTAEDGNFGVIIGVVD